MENTFSNRELSKIHFELSRGDLSTKYNYKTKKGAEAWLKIENLEKEKLYKPYSAYESDLLIKNKDVYLNEIWKNSNKIVIFDFWPGEWRAVEGFLKEISKEKKIFYHSFDISKDILEKNKQKIQKITNIEYDSSIIDFEDSSFFELIMETKEKYNNKILGLLLGNTIGNFSSINSILKNILAPFSIDDKLVLWIAKSDLKNQNWIRETLKWYKSKEVNQFVESTLNYLWISSEQFDYDVEFNEKETSIDMTVIFKENTIIKIKEKEIFFKKDQKIRIGKSEKADDVKMTKIFSDLNIRIANMSTSKDDDYVQFCLSNKTFY